MDPRASIVDIHPDRAAYHPGESARLQVEVRNDLSATFAGRLIARLTHLTETVTTAGAPVSVAPGESAALSLPLDLPRDDFRGYGVDAQLYGIGNMLVSEASTALDVLSDWSLAPRYGFFAEFPEGEPDTDERVAALARYHVNVVQFYDWMWRHYALLPPPGEEEPFADGMGRRVSLTTVKRKIAAVQRLGMAALAYGAVYGAEPEYFLAHPELGLYRPDGTPESLERLFYIMNIAEGSPWTDLIVAEYVRAVAGLGFDGIHMDQYGFPKVARAGSGSGPEVDLAAAFGPLIDRSAAAVAAARPGARVLFNNVNDWPTALTAPRDQAAVYVEVWPPHDTYGDLQRLIEAGRAAAGRQDGGNRRDARNGRNARKHVILAAYIAPLGAARQDEEVARAEEAARLAAAAVFANGGFHLLLGERDGALCDPYYPRYAHLRPEFAQVMRRYYDFSVRYENWLHDPALALLPDDAVSLAGAPYSSEPRAGSVWSIARRAAGCTTLSLVNLAGLADTRWNAPHDPPAPQKDIDVTLSVPDAARSVVLASPDRDAGRPRVLPFTQQAYGLRFTVPYLDRWCLAIVTTS